MTLGTVHTWMRLSVQLFVSESVCRRLCACAWPIVQVAQVAHAHPPLLVVFHGVGIRGFLVGLKHPINRPPPPQESHSNPGKAPNSKLVKRLLPPPSELPSASAWWSVGRVCLSAANATWGRFGQTYGQTQREGGSVSKRHTHTHFTGTRRTVAVGHSAVHTTCASILQLGPACICVRGGDKEECCCWRGRPRFASPSRRFTYLI